MLVVFVLGDGSIFCRVVESTCRLKCNPGRRTSSSASRLETLQGGTYATVLPWLRQGRSTRAAGRRRMFGSSSKALPVVLRAFMQRQSRRPELMKSSTDAYILNYTQ